MMKKWILLVLLGIGCVSASEMSSDSADSGFDSSDWSDTDARPSLDELARSFEREGLLPSAYSFGSVSTPSSTPSRIPSASAMPRVSPLYTPVGSPTVSPTRFMEPKKINPIDLQLNRIAELLKAMKKPVKADDTPSSIDREAEVFDLVQDVIGFPNGDKEIQKLLKKYPGYLPKNWGHILGRHVFNDIKELEAVLKSPQDCIINKKNNVLYCSIKVEEEDDFVWKTIFPLSAETKVRATERHVYKSLRDALMHNSIASKGNSKLIRLKDDLLAEVFVHDQCKIGSYYPIFDYFDIRNSSLNETIVISYRQLFGSNEFELHLTVKEIIDLINNDMERTEAKQDPQSFKYITAGGKELIFDIAPLLNSDIKKGILVNINRDKLSIPRGSNLSMKLAVEIAGAAGTRIFPVV